MQRIPTMRCYVSLERAPAMQCKGMPDYHLWILGLRNLEKPINHGTGFESSLEVAVDLRIVVEHEPRSRGVVDGILGDEFHAVVRVLIAIVGVIIKTMGVIPHYLRSL